MSLVARELEVWEMPTKRRIWVGFNSSSPGIKLDLLHVRQDEKDLWMYCIVAGTNANGKVTTFVSRHSQKRHVMPKYMSELEWPTLSRAFTSIEHVDSGLYILSNGTPNLYAIKLDEAGVALDVSPLTTSMQNITKDGIVDAKHNRWYAHNCMRLLVRTEEDLYFKDSDKAEVVHHRIGIVVAAEWVTKEDAVCVTLDKTHTHIYVVNMFTKVTGPLLSVPITVTSKPVIAKVQHNRASVVLGDKEVLISEFNTKWRASVFDLTAGDMVGDVTSYTVLEPWVVLGTSTGAVSCICSGNTFCKSSFGNGLGIRDTAIFPTLKRLFVLQDDGLWDLSMNEECLGAYDLAKMLVQYTVPVVVTLCYFFYFK